ncbi:MAG: DUF2510 domain-containing protein [Propionibacteriaceae bacterium]|jgi:hypothetical protein|nr:DUF2510 domain-containing protein [Propionibacteriaceae bacterium]
MTAAPPGWYSDPNAPQTLRWFDGQQWTAHTQPAAAQPQPPQPPQPGLTQTPTATAPTAAKKSIFARWWFWLIIVVAIVVVAAAALSSGSDDGTVSVPPAGGTTTTEGSEPKTSDSPVFGQTYTWSDGSAVTISAPEPYTITSEYIEVPEGMVPLEFMIKFENHTGESWNSVMFTSNVLSGGKAATDVFDIAGGIGLSAVDVPDGQSIEWPVVYAVADPGDIVMTVTPDMGLAHKKVTYQLG